ncbi:MAG: acetamidase/formamidase family protein [Chloroflexi bacterium]|nr:acetamidase/formamidase family protein [Chloroflexota bacterium]MDA1240148.1 acetamidase/formamidase family protein [Chloroflexota bacterium]
MAHHELGSGIRHYAWDNALKPLLTIDPGDTVRVHSMDAGDGFIQPDTRLEDLGKRVFKGHALTGPIAVRGAEPGDTLQIDVVALQPGPFGYTSFGPGRGLLPDDFDGPFLQKWDLTQDPTPFRPGIAIPQEPFLGVMGVALAEPGQHNTSPPRRNGGNADVKQLTAGSTVYLPVLVPGALFSCGDGHAAQGDGEVCITAIETSMTSTLRFDVIKGWEVPEMQFRTAGPLTPRTNTGRWFGTTGHSPDLMEASRQAVRHMIDHLGRHYGLSREEAYILCSVAVDLKVSEVVDAPNWIVSALLPESIFSGA